MRRKGKSALVSANTDCDSVDGNPDRCPPAGAGFQAERRGAPVSRARPQGYRGNCKQRDSQVSDRAIQQIAMPTKTPTACPVGKRRIRFR